MIQNSIVIRSGGDIGSAIAHKLFRSGFPVIILETDNPLAIRRRVSFSEAVYDHEVMVEGVLCRKANSVDDLPEILNAGAIALLVDAQGTSIPKIMPLAVVDAILAKRNLNTRMDMAPLTVGLGPGFTAGADVSVVIETNRGHNLGRLFYEGEAEKNTGIPGIIGGYGSERVLRASTDGIVRVVRDIGEQVEVGDIVFTIGDETVRTVISGVVRGCIRDGTSVVQGLKIGDVDPRGKIENCDTISDKARCIAGGVLEAILNFTSNPLKTTKAKEEVL